MSRFDRAQMISYYCSVVPIAIVAHIYLLVENRKNYVPRI